MKVCKKLLGFVRILILLCGISMKIRERTPSYRALVPAAPPPPPIALVAAILFSSFGLVSSNVMVNYL